MFQRQILLTAHTFLSSKKDITKLNLNGFLNLWKTVYPFKMFSHTHFSSHLPVLTSCQKKPGKIVLNEPAGDLSPQHLTLSLQCEQGLWEWNAQTDDTQGSQECIETEGEKDCFGEFVLRPSDIQSCVQVHTSHPPQLYITHSMHSLKALFPLWERKEVEKYMGVC